MATTPLTLQLVSPSIALTAAWLMLLRWSAGSFWWGAAFGLPGTFLHEMTHIAVGWLLRAKPIGMSLWPVKRGNRWIMGSASFANINLLNAGPVAFAPLSLLLPAWWLISEQSYPAFEVGNWTWWAGSSFIAANCLFSATPSKEDIKAGWLSFLCYAAILLLAHGGLS